LNLDAELRSGILTEDLAHSNITTQRCDIMVSCCCMMIRSSTPFIAACVTTDTLGGRQWSYTWTDNKGDLWLFSGNGFDSTTKIIVGKLDTSLIWRRNQRAQREDEISV